jgi:MFS family permease
MSAVADRPELDAPPPLRRLPFYYGWVNVVVAAWAMTATLPGRTHGLGLIEEPLLTDLDISKVHFSHLNFWSVLAGALLCLPTGRLIDRLGARTVLVSVALALGAAVVGMSQVTEPTALFVVLTLVRGLGQGALSVVSMALVGKWFRRRLGPAMGLFCLLLGIGFMLTIPLVGYAVQLEGWRTAWTGVGLSLLLGLAPVSWLFVRSLPAPCDQALEAVSSEPETLATGNTMWEALRSPVFWAFTLAASLFNLVWSAFTLFPKPILAAHGFDDDTFIQVMTVLAMTGLVSNLLGGWLARRWPLGRLMALGMAAFALSLAVFPEVSTIPQVLLFAAVLGAGGGLITVVFFAVYSQVFGRAHLGQIQAVVQIVTVFASALGPVLLAEMHARFDSYDVLLWAAAPVVLGLGVASWLVTAPGLAPPVALELAKRSA